MSVFNCNIKYKKVEGDSYTSTYNKLLSQKFIDKYLNVATDVATWRKARAELNEQASAKLGKQVNLFEEKRLLNGIRAVPDMKLFGMIDQMKKDSITNYQPQFVRDNTEDETENSLVEQQEQVPLKPIEARIYESINQRRGTLIDEILIPRVQQQIDNFNELDTGKILSLEKITENKYLVKSEYNVSYLYKNEISQLEDIKTERIETDSNNLFSLPCIRN